MQQEIIKKKHEIIDIFLKKGVLVSSELLEEINDYEHVYRIFDILKSKQIEDLTVIGSDLSRLIKEEKQQGSKVKIIYSYKEEPKKREPQDFVDHFNNRYKSIEKILKQHQELKNITSINKIPNKKEKEAATIIGIVTKKQHWDRKTYIVTLVGNAQLT